MIITQIKVVQRKFICQIGKLSAWREIGKVEERKRYLELMDTR